MLNQFWESEIRRFSSRPLDASNRYLLGNTTRSVKKTNTSFQIGIPGLDAEAATQDGLGILHQEPSNKFVEIEIESNFDKMGVSSLEHLLRCEFPVLRVVCLCFSHAFWCYSCLFHGFVPPMAVGSSNTTYTEPGFAKMVLEPVGIDPSQIECNKLTR